MSLEMFCQRQRRLACFADTQEQGAHAPLQQPGLERTQNCACLGTNLTDPLPQFVFFGRYQYAGDDIAVTVQVLGCRVHDDVGTVFYGSRQHGRRYRGIHSKPCADSTRDFGGGCNIDHVPGRVAGRFNPDQLRFTFLDGVGERIRISSIEEIQA